MNGHTFGAEPDPSEAGLALDRVSISYGDVPVVPELSLTVREGEVLVLTGPSGCGKSTLLRALAGLLRPDSGTVLAAGTPVESPSADRALVFQDDALLPWLTVRGNIDLALRLRRVRRADRHTRVERWISEVGLTGFGDHLPRQLSGGMRQRVQLARTLVGAPRAVLMDEPFGALDSQTRSAMQDLLARTLHTHRATVVFVTHDVDEALRLGDRVAVLGPAGTGLRDIVDVPSPRSSVSHSARERIRAALGVPDPAPTGQAPGSEGPTDSPPPDLSPPPTPSRTTRPSPTAHTPQEATP